MKKLLLLLIFSPFYFVQAQEEDDDNMAQLYIDHNINEFTKYDFSNIFNPKDYEYIGYMGDNFQRLYIHFVQVTKSLNSPTVYDVKGMWRQKEVVKEFTGNITINKVRELIDSKEMTGQTEYDLLGTYTFESAGGLFKGNISSLFYLLKGKPYFDDLLYTTDGYSNNQFEGKYTIGQSIQKANWGICRIPDSKKLDIGVSEFIVDDPYIARGWKSYIDEGAKSEAEECREWWKGKEEIRITWETNVTENNIVKVNIFRNGKPLQTVTSTLDTEPTVTETIGNVTLEDVTFDGNRDLLINLGGYGSQFTTYYDCYAWNKSKQQFEYISSFKDICNPQISQMSRCIFSNPSATQMEQNFEKYEFIGNSFTLTSTVTQTFTNDDSCTFTEKKINGDEETVIHKDVKSIEQLSEDWMEFLARATTLQ
ncbi:XAC2610-related protein [Phocaeicola oris]|uniref:XAC2610-related protein n=1 Tax=Phocaeicola oris TaxID=2896850 RepID=UPI00234E8CA0|nr:hypothetical protein [Phocaeicola oris]MCE2616786.1 hypothetical protein [Phocaeicola oris]